ncbi:MAG: DNA alkylation repair protein, partial [Spirochaetota bacterium]
MDELLKSLRDDLKKNSEEKVRLSGERYFKEHVALYGVKTAVVRKISSEHFKTIRNMDKKKIFSLCEKLWQSGIMEESFVA